MPRLALALCVSLLAHAGLVGLFWLPAQRPIPQRRGADGPSLRVVVEGWEPPRAPAVVKPDEYIDVKVEPSLRQASGTYPIPEGLAGSEPGAPATSGGGMRQGGDGVLAAPSSRRVVWLIDRSISMGPSGGLERAKRELREALASLPPDAWFQVLFYNQGIEPVRAAGTTGLLLADPATIEQTLSRLDDFPASGGTNHAAALRAALWLRPDTLFLVTDADDLSERVVRDITRANSGRARLEVVELSRHRRSDSPLARLARLNGGTHRLLVPVP